MLSCCGNSKLKTKNSKLLAVAITGAPETSYSIIAWVFMVRVKPSLENPPTDIFHRLGLVRATFGACCSKSSQPMALRL
jgi:hypothetical protein